MSIFRLLKCNLVPIKIQKIVIIRLVIISSEIIIEVFFLNFEMHKTVHIENAKHLKNQRRIIILKISKLFQEPTLSPFFNNPEKLLIELE